MWGPRSEQRVVPFFQALSSITASGKTIILADAVSSIAEAWPVKPVVLWLSKGKVVVEQTYDNLLPGGKYNHFLKDFEIRALAELDANELAENPRAFVFFATVGTFNQKDKERGSLLIYRSEVDTTEVSVWDALKQRPYREDVQRPLVIVYDEAHNLSDQQTDLLVDLQPLAFLVASATMRLPSRLAQEIGLLKQGGRSDADLTTTVVPSDVVKSELVKSTVLMKGYRTRMEEAVSGLLADFRLIEADAVRYASHLRPKAIYVCNTNIVEGDDRRRDDAKRPFNQREAPPILIWRYLVEQGVDPSEIAVYCSLIFHQSYPPPRDFKLFKGGDSDYGAFTRGNYRHIIFNLSLQEGWDDPECYLAYIDKSMRSPVQVEQVIGRVLRQPSAKYYPTELLNTASFYVRVDKDSVFAEAIKAVDKKLQAEFPGIRVIQYTAGKEPFIEVAPKLEIGIPAVALDTTDAASEVAQIIDQLNDYRGDTVNTRGTGGRSVVTLQVGIGQTDEARWERLEEANRVRARWIFEREIRKRYPGALGVVDTSDRRFDARIGVGSPAESYFTEVAEKIVNSYLDAVRIVQKSSDPYIVGAVLARRSELNVFENSIHEGYSNLNADELEFARHVDLRGVVWTRNPSQTGYRIPLVSRGFTAQFFPDFIIWTDDAVHLVDPKGGHLIVEAATRKLLNIRSPRGATRELRVWLFSKGTWKIAGAQPELVHKEGYTMWTIGSDGSKRGKALSDIGSAVGLIVR